MNALLWLLVGVVLGGLASIETGAHAPRRVLVNVCAGMVGALIAGWFLSGWFLAVPFAWEAPPAGDFSLAGLVVAPLGAIVLLAVVHLARLTKVP